MACKSDSDNQRPGSDGPVEADARPPLGASMDTPLRARAGHYESGSQEFESLRARQQFQRFMRGAPF